MHCIRYLTVLCCLLILSCNKETTSNISVRIFNKATGEGFPGVLVESGLVGYNTSSVRSKTNAAGYAEFSFTDKTDKNAFLRVDQNALKDHLIQTNDSSFYLFEDGGLGEIHYLYSDQSSRHLDIGFLQSRRYRLAILQADTANPQQIVYGNGMIVHDLEDEFTTIKSGFTGWIPDFINPDGYTEIFLDTEVNLANHKVYIGDNTLKLNVRFDNGEELFLTYEFTLEKDRPSSQIDTLYLP